MAKRVDSRDTNSEQASGNPPDSSSRRDGGRAGNHAANDRARSATPFAKMMANVIGVHHAHDVFGDLSEHAISLLLGLHSSILDNRFWTNPLRGSSMI